MLEIINKIKELGVNNVSLIKVKDICLDPVFRKMCASNSCGMYGKNYQCPPHIGEIEKLMNKVSSFTHAIVYQNIYEIEDSYDFEGMMGAGKKHNQMTYILQKYLKQRNDNTKLLLLGAGGCGLCEKCAILTNEPCRHPEYAISSLEAYGINVSKLATTANMKYINGINTVTYFGIVLLDIKSSTN